MIDPQPFFSTPGGVPRGMRRLLLISFHFPPSETAGALRWGKLAWLAAERGWGLDVVTLDPSSLERVRDDSLRDLPSGTRVFGVPLPKLGWERMVARARSAVGGLAAGRKTSDDTTGADVGGPTQVWRPGALARAYGAILDNAVHGRWSSNAGRLACRLAVRGGYDAVVSCGPPHMAHVAGRRAAAEHNVPFIMDLRDPWRLVERLAASIDSPLWRWHAAWHERRLVARADLIVMNTEPARDAMQNRYAAAAPKIITVMNGFDETDAPQVQPAAKFRVTYAGSIYLDRDPRTLFEAARVLIECRAATPDEFGITLVGSVDMCPDGPTEIVARDAGIALYVELLTHRSRVELRDILARSAVLVSLPQDSHMAVPSKLFEYMEYDAWILALAEPHSATARLLRNSAADVSGAGDTARIAEILVRRFDAYRRGDYPVRLATDARFSRRAQAEPLYDALERLTASPRGTREGGG